MQFKEEVDLLQNWNCVCWFCLASKPLMLLREVEVLKVEVRELQDVKTSHSDDQRHRAVLSAEGGSQSHTLRKYQGNGRETSAKLRGCESQSSLGAVVRG